MKMLRFVKMDPCRNTTVFVLDPVPRNCYKPVSQAIMAPQSVGAEQVGFICPSDTAKSGLRMEMMGGEFCGNASRSFAAWMFFRSGAQCFQHTNDDGSGSLELDVSGTNGLIQAKIEPFDAAASCYVSCRMPLPMVVRHGSDLYFGEYSFVAYEGISHIVIWKTLPEHNDVDEGRRLAHQLGYNADSIGIMYYNAAKRFIRPLVHIEEVGTTVWETSCGSGSCAVAAAMADRDGGQDGVYEIHQPGGFLTVHTQRRGDHLMGLTLGGIVEMTAQGILYLDDLEVSA